MITMMETLQQPLRVSNVCYCGWRFDCKILRGFENEDLSSKERMVKVIAHSGYSTNEKPDHIKPIATKKTLTYQ